MADKELIPINIGNVNDGGNKWKLDAVHSVKTWLTNHLPDATVVA